MNQAKINAILRQVFAILGSLIVFVPALAPVAELLPQTETILNEIIGTGVTLWALIGQYRTVLDSQSSGNQVQSLGLPSFAKGIVHFVTMS